MMTAYLHEWQLFVKSPATLALLGLLALLTTIGAANGVHRNLQREEAARVAVAADAASFAGKRAALVDLEAGRTREGQYGSPRKAHQAILSAGRPMVPGPPELAVLSSATARATPDLLRISILTRHVDQQPRLDDPTNRLDGAFDLVFVTLWIVPLVALVIGSDLLAGDRERGIAALLASQGTALRTLVIRRLRVRFLALYGLTGAITVAAAIMGEEVTPRMATGLLAWLVTLAIWVAFWLLLAAAVNARARSAASAALALLSLWIVVAILVPAVSGSVVSALAPPPDRLQGVLALRDIEADLNRRRREVTAEYYAAAPGNIPKVTGDEYEQYFVTELYPRHLAFDQAFSPVAEAMESARLRQAHLMRLAAFTSPLIAFKLITDDLAGFAPERRIGFLSAVDQYQRSWRNHFDHKLASMSPLTIADYDRKPEFVPPSEPLVGRWSRIVVLMMALVLPTVVASVWADRWLRRATPNGVD